MTINSKYFRTRRFARLRHGRKTRAFVDAAVTALASSATGQTVSVLRTTNTKAEGLVTVGGNLSAGNFLTVNGQTYTFAAALTEIAAFATITNDATDVTAADTVTIGGVVYTFKSALTEAKAVGTLTNDGVNVTDGDTVTIGSKVYTLQSSLTNVDGHVKIGASNTATMTNLFHAINASGGTVGTDYATLMTANTQVVATNPSGTTVVVTSKVVGTASNAIATTEASTHLAWGAATLAGGVNSVANEVLRGVSATASMTSLFEAITAGSNAGTDYSTATVAHSTVTATNPTSATVKVTAKSTGIAGNSIAVSEASTHLSWGVTTLSGGVAAVANQILIDDTAAHSRDNLLNAINGGAGVATKYSTGTVSSPAVVASASSGNLLLTAAATVTTSRGKDIKLAKSGTNLTLPAGSQLDGPQWTATSHAFVDGEGPFALTAGTTLPAGFPAANVWVHVIDANKIALATSLSALRDGAFVQTTDAGTGTLTLTRAVDAAGMFDVLKRNKPRTVVAATDIDSLR